MLRNLLVALSLENRSFAKMSLGSSEGGQSLYALEDMLLEINIKQQMLSLKDLKNKVFVPEGKNEKTELEIHNFTGAGGVALSMYNTDESIYAFAEASRTLLN